MILLVSFNLRTPMTSVGPVMDLIQTEYGMSAGMAGLITTLPLIMFGAASPFVPAVNRRLGYSRTMCIAIASITPESCSGTSWGRQGCSRAPPSSASG